MLYYLSFAVISAYARTMRVIHSKVSDFIVNIQIFACQLPVSGEQLSHVTSVTWGVHPCDSVTV